MKIIKPQTVSLLTRPFEFQHEFWLGLATLAFMPTGETPSLLPESAMWPFLAEELPPDLPLDAAIPKVRAELLAIAHAHAPGGMPIPLFDVSIRLGPLTKTLSVCGDRRVSGSRVSEPIPFTTLPIDWAHAFGGVGFAANPLGKGALPIDGTDGRVYAAPNVIDRKLAGEAHQLLKELEAVPSVYQSGFNTAGSGPSGKRLATIVRRAEALAAGVRRHLAAEASLSLADPEVPRFPTDPCQPS